MATLLIVHHIPSPPTRALLEAALQTLRDEPDLADVQVRTAAALTVGAAEVLAADGYLLFTPANFGYMSGALKHAFDTCYYPALGETDGRPYALVVHGNDDTTGAVRSVQALAQGLAWRSVGPAVTVIGAPDRSSLEEVGQLAATLAAHLLDG